MTAAKRCLADGLTPEYERQAQELSPFELKNDLIDRAKRAQKSVLNAGRGNPNFLNTLARRGFAKLMEFSVDACLVLDNDVALRPQETGIYRALLGWIQSNPSEGVRFLRDAVSYAVVTLGLNPDDVVYELADGILGDFYPSPPRILTNVEKIVSTYLNQVLLKGEGKPAEFDYFATEGGTAGMVYAFKSLEENFLLNKGDKVAIVTPIFSPYLEIPQLNDFEFEVIPIQAEESKGWQINKDEIKKLEDRSIKVLYMVNPANPTAMALNHHTLTLIEQAVKKNPELIILVDAVYATFVDTFESLIHRLPGNCLIVYSFSKYFGATGWRLGAMMLHRENVIDQRIRSFPEDWRKSLAERYHIVSEQVDTIGFIDRLVLDSRDVALAHTAGLSCPQQVMLALFCLYNLLHQKTYKEYVRGLLNKRIAALYGSLDNHLEYSHSPQDTHYYTLIDILELADKYEKGLGEYMTRTFYPVDFVYCLAIDQGCVCLPGYGFFEPEQTVDGGITPTDRNNWSIRVSLANLTQEYDKSEYSELGSRITAVIDKYFHDYQGESGQGK